MHQCMTRFTAKVVSGHRVTIPEPVREKHGVEEDDFVELDLLSVDPGDGE